MRRLEVSGAVRPIYGSLGVKRLIVITIVCNITWVNITFVIVIISNGAGDVGQKPEVIDA